MKIKPLVLLFYVASISIALAQNNKSLQTKEGEIKPGTKIKFMKPSNGNVYAYAYLKSLHGAVYISGTQYESVEMQVIKLKYEKDKLTKEDVAVIVVGLPKQSRAYYIDVEVLAALSKNEIQILK